ncbi:MAG: electron transfer flavoprotein subunit alpha/FixB family protein [Flavobacteriales bacterium]|nr:electron transfer flavoprotein subunit alpha/FixB family protein [Flavobacteriales bacterium]
MSVLIVVDTKNGQVKKSSLEAAQYGAKVAAAIGGEAVALSLNANNAEVLGTVGVNKVLNVTDASISASDPQKVVAAIVAAANQIGAKVVVFAHDSTGKAVAPRLSAKSGAGLVTNVTSLPDTSNGFVVSKNVFSGKAHAQVNILSDEKIVSILPNAFGVKAGEGSASVEAFSVDVSGINSGITVKEVKGGDSKVVPLPEAELVVSAGRGLKGPENWGMIEEMAEILGATTACSRPVADIGWRPHHEHVGQTGVAIRPNLYIAVGISGAIQHLAGVNGSKVIVVINKDPEAPFFKAADYGVVGDAFEVVPRLNEAFRKFKAANG